MLCYFRDLSHSVCVCFLFGFGVRRLVLTRLVVRLPTKLEILDGKNIEWNFANVFFPSLSDATHQVIKIEKKGKEEKKRTQPTSL